MRSDSLESTPEVASKKVTRLPDAATSELKEAGDASAPREQALEAAVRPAGEASSAEGRLLKIEGQTLAELVAGLVQPIRSLEEESGKLGGRLSKALARARKAAGDEAATKARCAAEIARLEAKVPLLEARAEKAESELAALRLEVGIVRDRETEAARSQKDLLLAFLEKVLFSSHFGDVSAGLAEVMNASAVAEVVKEVAAAYPDLDLSKFKREEPSAEEVLRRYAQVMAKFVRALPVVKAMLGSSTLWTAESVRDCSVDQDVGLEATLAELGYFKQAPEAGVSGTAETEAPVEAAGTEVPAEAARTKASGEAAGDAGGENAGAIV